jgi:hypothetical protein
MFYYEISLNYSSSLFVGSGEEPVNSSNLLVGFAEGSVISYDGSTPSMSYNVLFPTSLFLS